MKTDFKNILVVRTDRIGDVILTTPVFRAIKKVYPQCRLTVLLSPSTVPLVQGNPFIDEILIDDKNGRHAGLLGYWSLVSELKRHHFDVVINFHTKKRSNLLCFLAGIPVRIGYKNNKFGFLLNHPLVDTRPQGVKHEAEYCLDVLKVIGVESSDLTLSIQIEKESEKWADEFFKSQNLLPRDKIIALHPGASDPSRRWPTKRFVELVQAIGKKYSCRILLVGDIGLKEIADEIIESSQVPCIDLIGKTTLSRLASILKRVTLMISNDSGPVHMAAALNLPLVSIFTRNQPGINHERWRPLGSKSRVVTVPPDNTQSFQKAGSADPKYMELITTEQVLEAVDALFKLC